MFYKAVAAAVAATIVGTMSCMPADARTKPQKRYEVQKPAPDARIANALAGRPHNGAIPHLRIRYVPIRWIWGAVRSLLPLSPRQARHAATIPCACYEFRPLPPPFRAHASVTPGARPSQAPLSLATIDPRRKRHACASRNGARRRW